MKKAAVFVIIALSMLLCGCGGANVEELYSLPQPREEFLQLQALIDSEIVAGAEYSSPTAGSNRKSVQTVDLDGDGTEEFLVFMKNKDMVPIIIIYCLVDGEYAPVTTITGEGSAIGRVEFADLDGDKMQEIIVSWKISTQIIVMKAYSVRSWASTVLMSADCTDFLVGEFNSSGGADVAVLNFSDEVGMVELYFTDRAGEIKQTSTKLSASLTAADRFRIDKISENVPAIFVEGHYKDETEWYLTDVVVFSAGVLQNITMDEETGDSIAKRNSAVYSLDIDGNGTLDVPFSEKLYRQPKVETDYYVYDWFSYNADGSSQLCASTYHCESDGWYYVLPGEWRDSLTVRRESGKTGEKPVVLSTVDEVTEEVTDRLTIYTITDENRRERAKLPDRFVLLSSATTIYAAKFVEQDDVPVTEELKTEIISRFHLIYSEWMPGAV